MVRTLLICGLVAGVVAGVLAFAFETVVGEPAVDAAIAYEEAGAPAVSAAGEPQSEPVSRNAQKGLGLLSASLVYGLALGGLFALVFALGYGRIGRGRWCPGTTALGLAAAAFVVVFLVPALKYPPNPPAVGDPDTIGERTALYLTMVGISVAAAVAGWRLRRGLAARLSGDTASVLGALGYVVIATLAALALPGGAAIPPTFPADTLWEFRVASIGTQLVLWSTIGAVFAPLAQRAMSGRPLPSPRRSRRFAAAGD
ncbi:MAG: CbtA family protein [Solirubrobacteraceae bacterium MAG38_C4-C5]|nr:CbtA family protein [Candidatus Siliceabacter maunaloa]